MTVAILFWDVLRYRLFEIFSYGLTWSADGRTIAFETSPNRACTGISLINLESRAVRPLIPCDEAEGLGARPGLAAGHQCSPTLNAAARRSTVRAGGFCAD